MLPGDVNNKSKNLFSKISYDILETVILYFIVNRRLYFLHLNRRSSDEV